MARATRPRQSNRMRTSMLLFSRISVSGRSIDYIYHALTLFVVIGLVCAIPLATFAQNANVDGEWIVELTLPLGDQTFTMVIDQKGGVLTGHMVNEFGQFDLVGSINRDQVKLQWSFPDGGKLLDVTFNGKASRNSMSGVAKVG